MNLDSSMNLLSDRSSKINKPRHLDMRPVTGDKAIPAQTKDIELEIKSEKNGS